MGRMLLILGMVLGLGCSTGSAEGQEGPPPAEKKVPPTLVKVDIAEEVDGREYTGHRVQYQTKKMLLNAGLHVESARETRWDKDFKGYAPPEGMDVDFTVRGKARAALARRPTWYEGVVAYVYKAEAEIVLESSGGEEIARFRATLERSDTDREKAILKTLRVLGHLVAKAVVQTGPIEERCPEKRKKLLQDIIEKIEKDIKDHGGAVEDLSEKEDPKGGK
jgi:hypothetical protein